MILILALLLFIGLVALGFASNFFGIVVLIGLGIVILSFVFIFIHTTVFGYTLDSLGDGDLFAKERAAKKERKRLERE